MPRIFGGNMDQILNNLLNNPGSDIDIKNIMLLRNYLASKSSKERLDIVISLKRPRLVELLLIDNEERLECYVSLQKIMLRSFSDEMYEILMDSQDDKLVFKFLDDLKLSYLKSNLIYCVVDEKLKIDYIIKSDDDENKYLVARSLKSDNDKYRCLEYIRDVHFKIMIIREIQDEYIRAKALMTLIPNFRIEICKTIKNQDILCNLYEKNIEYGFSYNILCLIQDDNLKKKNLNRYSIQAQIEIINSLIDEKNVQEIIWDSKYDNYCDKFIGKLTSEEFIIKYFMKNDDVNFKIKIINGICDNKLKSRLIYLLDDIKYQGVLLGNISDNKEDILKEISLDDIEYDIDPLITIGVELEACCDHSDVYLTMKKILGNWDIKLDRTVSNGVEITSPILHYDENSLRELKYVCVFLVQNNFYTSEKCGGHIHLGFDYFESVDEFKVFMQLYQHVEDILYLISNRCYSVIRHGINDYARRLNPMFKKININWDAINALPECVTLIKSSCDSRYYGLNLYNAFEDKNTIEFRMPNGEIEFKEVLLNIRLFAKMLELSKKIANSLTKDVLTCEEVEQLKLYQQLITGEQNNYEKLPNLLRLLFTENEYNLYFNRYTTNRKTNKRKN